MPTVSIIIPIYNVEKYIIRCLNSIVEQECEGISIECLLVDDCSPDNSMRLVTGFINTYKGTIDFQVIRQKENHGLSCARNKGFHAAKGEFVMFVDSDDCLVPQSLHYMIEEVRKHPQVDMAIGNHYDEENKSRNFESLQEPVFISDPFTIVKDAYERKLSGNAWNKLIRRDVLVKNNIMFAKGLIYEDILWTIEVAKVTSSVLLLPKVTYLYKYNATSIMHSKSERAEKIVYSLIFTCNKLMDGITKEHWGRCCLFIFNHMLQAVDINMQYPCQKAIQQDLYNTKKRLMLLSLKGWRIASALFFMTMFCPLCGLLKWKVFRQNYHKFIRLLYRIDS